MTQFRTEQTRHADHLCLFCRFNKEKLHSLVTERCYPVSSEPSSAPLFERASPTVGVASVQFGDLVAIVTHCFQEMTRGNRYKTIRWQFVESLEPPRVVHARCPDMVSKGNLYGQVTVRMHSRQVRAAPPPIPAHFHWSVGRLETTCPPGGEQHPGVMSRPLIRDHVAPLQTLAIYDRFGRLLLGDEQQPKDVLEYLVIERHLVNPYSRWRLHGKIVPAWAPAKDPIIKVRTFCVHTSGAVNRFSAAGVSGPTFATYIYSTRHCRIGSFVRNKKKTNILYTHFKIFFSRERHEGKLPIKLWVRVRVRV